MKQTRKQQQTADRVKRHRARKAAEAAGQTACDCTRKTGHAWACSVAETADSPAPQNVADYLAAFTGYLADPIMGLSKRQTAFNALTDPALSARTGN